MYVSILTSSMLGCDGSVMSTGDVEFLGSMCAHLITSDCKKSWGKAGVAEHLSGRATTNCKM